MLGTMYFNLAEPEAGSLNRAEAVFGPSGLRSVVLTRVRLGPPRRDAELEYKELRRTLVAQNGEPVCREFIDGTTCEWSKAGARLQLRMAAVSANLAQPPSERYTAISLEFAEPAAPDRDTPRLIAADLATRKDPRAWSRIGMYGLRLGMGLGDVIATLGPTSSPMCEFHCEGKAGGAGRIVECKLNEFCSRRAYVGLPVESLTFSPDGSMERIRFEKKGMKRAELASFLELFKARFASEFARADTHTSADSWFGIGPRYSVFSSLVQVQGTWIIDLALNTLENEPKPSGGPQKKPPAADGTLDI